MPEFQKNGGDIYDAGLNPNGVSKVIVRCKEYVDKIQFEYKDGTKSTGHGGEGGEENVFSVDSDDHIIKVNVWQGYGTDAVQFVTKGGHTSPRFGGPGGELQVYEAPKEQNLVGLVGFHGRSKIVVDRFVPKFDTIDFVTTVNLELVPFYSVDGGSSGEAKRKLKTIKSHSSSSHTSSTVTTSQITTLFNQARLLSK